MVRLDRHWERLEKSAELLGQPFLVSREWLRTMLRRAVERAGIDLPRIRLTVPADAPDSAIITLEPFNPPPDNLYQRGVRIALVEMERALPRAKDSRFVEARTRILKSLPPDVYEAVLCDREGRVREGMTSNFYAVLDGSLRTAERKVLEGIARGMVLEIALEVLPVTYRSIHCDDLPRVQEAMLSSASRGLIPIVQIDSTPIGGGRPGPYYLALRARYDALVEQELEPL